MSTAPDRHSVGGRIWVSAEYELPRKESARLLGPVTQADGSDPWSFQLFTPRPHLFLQRPEP